MKNILIVILIILSFNSFAQEDDNYDCEAVVSHNDGPNTEAVQKQIEEEMKEEGQFEL